MLLLLLLLAIVVVVKITLYSVALNYTMLIIHSHFNTATFIIFYVLDVVLGNVLKSPVYLYSQLDHNILKNREDIMLILIAPMPTKYSCSKIICWKNKWQSILKVLNKLLAIYNENYFYYLLISTILY